METDKIVKVLDGMTSFPMRRAARIQLIALENELAARKTPDEVKKMLASSMKKFEGNMIALLLEAAADPQFRDLTGKAALELAAKRLAGMK